MQLQNIIDSLFQSYKCGTIDITGTIDISESDFSSPSLDISVYFCQGLNTVLCDSAAASREVLIHHTHTHTPSYTDCVCLVSFFEHMDDEIFLHVVQLSLCN